MGSIKLVKRNINLLIEMISNVFKKITCSVIEFLRKLVPFTNRKDGQNQKNVENTEDEISQKEENVSNYKRKAGKRKIKHKNVFRVKLGDLEGKNVIRNEITVNRKEKITISYEKEHLSQLNPMETIDGQELDLEIDLLLVTTNVKRTKKIKALLDVVGILEICLSKMMTANEQKLIENKKDNFEMKKISTTEIGVAANEEGLNLQGDWRQVNPQTMVANYTIYKEITKNLDFSDISDGHLFVISSIVVNKNDEGKRSTRIQLKESKKMLIKEKKFNVMGFVRTKTIAMITRHKMVKSQIMLFAIGQKGKSIFFAESQAKKEEYIVTLWRSITQDESNIELTE